MLTTVWYANAMCQKRPILLILVSSSSQDQRTDEIFREITDNLIGCQIKYVFRTSTTDQSYNHHKMKELKATWESGYAHYNITVRL